MNTRYKAIQTIYNGYKFRSRLEARWAVFFDALGVKYEYEPEGFELPSGDYYLPDFRVKCYGVRGRCINPKDESFIGKCGICDFSLDGNAYSYEDGCRSDDAEIVIGNTVYWDMNSNDLTFGANGVCEKCPYFRCSYPFDLYIEVKGRMTQNDWNKIDEFSGLSGLKSPSFEQIKLGDKLTNPILVVGSIPYNFEEMRELSYEPMDGIACCQFNYLTIDGDDFGAYPTSDNGHFYLMGDKTDYMSRFGIDSINSALLTARQARFERGETPTAQRARAKCRSLNIKSMHSIKSVQAPMPGAYR